MTPRTRDYAQPLGDHGDIVRIRFTTDRGQLIRYTVQYEVWYEQRHWPAMRYDNAHGFPHRDTLDRMGKTIRKDPMPAETLAQAFSMALIEIEANWPRFRDRFLRGTR